MSTKRNNPETIAIHGGDYRSDPSTNAVAVPIYRTTSYQFDSTEHAANDEGAGRAPQARRRKEHPYVRRNNWQHHHRDNRRRHSLCPQRTLAVAEPVGALQLRVAELLR